LNWLATNEFTSLIGQDVALINPDPNADHAKGRVSFRQTIVDVGAQCVQGNLPLNLFLSTRDFSATKTTTAYDTNTFSIRAHRLLHGLFHGSTERDTLLQLLRNAAANQIRVQLRLANLDNVQAHTFLGQSL